MWTVLPSFWNIWEKSERFSARTFSLNHAEMDDHLGYQKSEWSDSDDYRNGYKSKRVNSSYGSMDIDVPQDRKSTFEPQIVKKHQKALFQTLQFITSSRKSNYPFRSVKCLWKIHSTNHAFRTKIWMRYDNFMILWKEHSCNSEIMPIE